MKKTELRELKVGLFIWVPIYFRTGYMKDRPARSVSFGYSQVDANQ